MEKGGSSRIPARRAAKGGLAEREISSQKRKSGKERGCAPHKKIPRKGKVPKKKLN